MSIIINMLKDLEKRDTTNRNMPDIEILKHKNKSFISTHKLRIYIITLSIILFILLISFLLIHQPKKQLNVLPNGLKISKQINMPVNEIKNDAMWLQPVQINGVTLQVKDNITEVTFLLSHPALYRLISDDLQNQIGLIFDNAQFQAELPPVNYLNTAIQRFSTEHIKNDTKFSFTLMPGAIIKNVTLNEVNNSAELNIAIEIPMTESSNTSDTATKSFKSPTAQSLLNQQYKNAISAVDNGDYQLAIENLSNLLKAAPDYSAARTSLAALLIDKGDQSQAKKIIESGLEINPNDLPLIELKARLLVTNGKIHQALALLQSASPPLAEYPDYYAYIAALYEKNNDDELAVRIYHQLININPQKGSWWFGLAVSLDKLGQTNQALNAYTRAFNEGHLNANSIAYLQNRLRILQEIPHETN